VSRYLFFVSELYSFAILRPLQAAIRARGDAVAWFLEREELARNLRDDEPRLTTTRAVFDWGPAAVFVPGNWVPHFFPGLKVEVFHGFSVGKRSESRGHFRIRGSFDLYCTQGPDTTAPFRELQRTHGFFRVEETGWPKLDPLFAQRHPLTGHSRPVVMYASTFTESLSSAPLLYEEIARQVARGDRYWLLTLHPKSDPALVDAYRRLAGPNARFVEADALVPALRAADVLVCDTSSVVSEFVVQRKPVVTFRNRAPKPHMIDISEPADLESALQRAFAPTEKLRTELATYADLIHPWRDGHSSERVLDAARRFLTGQFGDLSRKPVNLWRRLQMRAKLRNFGG